MTKLFPALLDRCSKSSVDMNVVVTPVMISSGSPIFIVSAVGQNGLTPTFFDIRAMISRAVIFEELAQRAGVADSAPSPTPAIRQNDRLVSLFMPAPGKQL